MDQYHGQYESIKSNEGVNYHIAEKNNGEIEDSLCRNQKNLLNYSA